MNLVEIRQHEIGRLAALAQLIGGARGARIAALSESLKASWKQFDTASGDARRPSEMGLVAAKYARWCTPRGPAARRRSGTARLIP